MHFNVTNDQVDGCEIRAIQNRTATKNRHGGDWGRKEKVEPGGLGGMDKLTTRETAIGSSHVASRWWK